MTTSKFFAGLLSLAAPRGGARMQRRRRRRLRDGVGVLLQYAAAICQIAVNPCGLSMDTCTTYQTGQCTAMNTAAITGTHRVFTPGNIGDCINKLKSAYGSTNPISSSTQASIDLACQYVWQGPGKTGTSRRLLHDAVRLHRIDQRIDHLRRELSRLRDEEHGLGEPSRARDRGRLRTNFYCAAERQTSQSARPRGPAPRRRPAPRPLRHQLALRERHLHAARRGGRQLHADSDCASAGYCDRFGGSPPAATRGSRSPTARPPACASGRG